ncbi:uncharacterized protein LOC116023557 [Ipomoea triloba]|uniref:uncharacterized protein LOC116023557 n=1 Tax=Ipomoea triloba TaxID=35885 RepID=UPI00125E6FBD|nr:uncharacterized protein LOC116023557 [Ipomoea triloba]
MEYTCNSKLISIAFFSLLFIASSFGQANQTFHANNESRKLKRIRAYLNKINKPAVKSIKSPDGDIIDCVLFHQQPAFDHPLLKGKKSLVNTTLLPKAHNNSNHEFKSFQEWRKSGETCPEGTVAIRRTTEQDILRAGSVRKFRREVIRYQSDGDDLEWALAFLDGGKYKGAAADVNVWAPRVSDNQEFSTAQIYVGAATNDQDANSLQAGSAISVWGQLAKTLQLLDGYVHSSPSVAIGARITTPSTYGGVQHDGYYEIRQDMDKERWVLRFLSTSNEIGYWPMSLFTHLNKGPATMLEFGGSVRNKKTNGVHTGTQMGSGHFAEEGFGKAAHISNIKMADDSNFGVPYSAGLLQTSAKSSNCYNVKFTANDKSWGSYIYYGGPGKNDNCP